ncbi:26158_t:CDS:1, partial [Dentiscutata erythropus]
MFYYVKEHTLFFGRGYPGYRRARYNNANLKLLLNTRGMVYIDNSEGG